MSERSWTRHKFLSRITALITVSCFAFVCAFPIFFNFITLYDSLSSVSRASPPYFSINRVRSLIYCDKQGPIEGRESSKIATIATQSDVEVKH